MIKENEIVDKTLSVMTPKFSDILRGICNLRIGCCNLRIGCCNCSMIVEIEQDNKKVRICALEALSRVK